MEASSEALTADKLYWKIAAPYSEYNEIVPRQVTGLHLAAYFVQHLQRLLVRLAASEDKFKVAFT